MIKTLTILLFALPVSADSIINKSVCDEMYEVILEEPEYINEQVAREIYERCIASIYQ